jgi:hypothetical protein
MSGNGGRAPATRVLDRLGLPFEPATDEPATATALASETVWVVARLLLMPVLAVGGLVAPRSIRSLGRAGPAHGGLAVAATALPRRRPVAWGLPADAGLMSC